MTIIEVRGQGGQLIERFRSHAATIRVGRAFDNDLVLEDEYISPHHLRLRREGEGWRCEDLDSLNGLRNANGAALEGSIHSGDELEIGRTTLHIYDEQHPTAPARLLDRTEERLNLLGRGSVSSALVAASALVTGLALFWGTSVEFEPLTVLSPIASSLLVTAAVAAVWALVGRLLRHRAHFLAHLSLWLGFGLLQLLTSFVARSIGYNASSAGLEELLDTLLYVCIMGAALWASLALATHLRGRRRQLAALGGALVFVGLEIAGELEFDRGFSSYPDYYSRLGAPSLLVARPTPDRELASALAPLFDLADAEIEEE